MARDSNKVDSDLGQRVEEHLKLLGLNTPTSYHLKESSKQKIAIIEKHMSAEHTIEALKQFCY